MPGGSFEGKRSPHQALGLTPKPSGPIIGDAIQEVVSSVVGIDGLVVLLPAWKVLRQHGGIPAFPHVILAPVDPVDVDVHEAAMRRDVAHRVHRVIREAVREVGPPLVHVVVSRAQIEGLELLGRSGRVLVAIKDREAQLGWTVERAEAQAHAALGEVRDVVPIA